jgi:hypothetical protein
MSIDKTYVTDVTLGSDTNGNTAILSISGSTAQLTATSFLSGPQGIQGEPGPNTINSSTTTPLNGYLTGNGSTVGVVTGLLESSNNLSDVANVPTARDNLGITVSSTAPSAPNVNDLWIDTT